VSAQRCHTALGDRRAKEAPGDPARVVPYPFPPPPCKQASLTLDLIVCQNMELNQPLPKGTLPSNPLGGVTLCNSLVWAVQLEEHAIKTTKHLQRQIVNDTKRMVTVPSHEITSLWSSSSELSFLAPREAGKHTPRQPLKPSSPRLPGLCSHPTLVAAEVYFWMSRKSSGF